jgi:hypothetical protein
LTENILSSDRFAIHIDTLMSKLTDSNEYFTVPHTFHAESLESRWNPGGMVGMVGIW